MHLLSRRRFLQQSAATMAASCLPVWSAEEANGAVLASFFVVGDTHFRADEEQTGQLHPRSAEYTAGLIDTLNRLPGTALPDTVGGGTLSTPVGLMHVGDLIDSGDKHTAKHQAMQHTEWAAYQAAFGMAGGDGRLKYPVMDIVGNHDAPQGTGYVIEQLAVRQRTRKGLKAISTNGLHYSWDWGGVHFVALGLIVGTDKSVDRKRRYAALDSLDFLKEDLAANAPKDQPLVIMHHVDMARYTAEKPDTDYTKWEWDPADVHAFHETIAGRRAAIFYGHTHHRDVFRWDGHSTKATEGVAVFNVDNGAHFGMTSQAFFHVEVRGDGLLVREYATEDGWKTGEWTPQIWRAKV